MGTQVVNNFADLVEGSWCMMGVTSIDQASSCSCEGLSCETDLPFSCRKAAELDLRSRLN